MHVIKMLERCNDGQAVGGGGGCKRCHPQPTLGRATVLLAGSLKCRDGALQLGKLGRKGCSIRASIIMHNKLLVVIFEMQKLAKPMQCGASGLRGLVHIFEPRFCLFSEKC
jgi:hypothetical protein